MKRTTISEEKKKNKIQTKNLILRKYNNELFFVLSTVRVDKWKVINGNNELFNLPHGKQWPYLQQNKNKNMNEKFWNLRP